MLKKKYEIDMCEGPILPKLLQFALPLMLSSVLQLLFNAADIIVVGRFSGKEALAAVGSTGQLINLLIDIFVGLSVGTNVLVARCIGAKDDRGTARAVHTSVLAGFVCGGILILSGILLAEPMLSLMGTPDDVMEKAALYVRVYFLGMPAVMLYNFGSAVLRAVGDTRRPLMYLTASGIINVIFNIFFVTVLSWDVAGVALATVISQSISAVLVLRCLLRAQGAYRVNWKQLKIYGKEMLEIIRIGVPAGLEGAVFSVSNVLIQSSVNSFGSVAMAGYAAASSIEGIVWIAMSAVVQANMSFISQNTGAGKYSRLNRIVIQNTAVIMTIGLVLGAGVNLIGKQLIGIYNTDPAVIAFGCRKLNIVARFAMIDGLMSVMGSGLRGLGYSLLPTTMTLLGACGLRVLWVFTIFASHPTPEVLFLSYPVTWAVTALCNTTCFIAARKKLPSEDGAQISVR